MRTYTAKQLASLSAPRVATLAAIPEIPGNTAFSKVAMGNFDGMTAEAFKPSIVYKLASSVRGVISRVAKAVQYGVAAFGPRSPALGL